MTIKLEGKRIYLRKFRKSDAKAIAMHANDASVSKYTNLPYPYTEHDAITFITKILKEPARKNDFNFGIVLKETGFVIGSISLEKVSTIARKAEVGFWLGKKYWKIGIADESLKLILEFGFKKTRLVRIWARVIKGNERSIKLLERNGFKYEGTLRKNLYKNEKWYDELRYGLLKEEARAIRV